MLWQYHVTGCQTLEKTLAEHTMQKNQKIQWLALIALNRALRTEFALIVASMPGVR